MARFLEDYKPKKKKEDEKKVAVKKQSSSSVSKQERQNQKSYGTTKAPAPKKATRTTSNTSGSVNKTAGKSTFMGGGSSVQKAQTGSTRTQTQQQPVTPSQRRKNAEANNNLKQTQIRNSRENFATAKEMMDARASEGRRQKQTAGVVNTTNARKEREARRIEAQRQKAGLNDQASRETRTAANRALKNTPALVDKAVKDTIGGHGKTIADITEMTAEKGTNAYAMKLGVDTGSKSSMDKIRADRERTVAEAKAKRKELQAEQEKRQAEWDEKTKDAKGLEKAYYGAVESGTGMLTDMALGMGTQAGSLLSMASRTYGQTRGQAEKEGATENEDRIYSLLQAGKESGTELMFPGAGLARKAYGRAGAGLGEIASNLLLKNLKGRAADAASAGMRLLGGVAEENAEEIAGWGLDPIIKEYAYGKNVRTRAAKGAMQERSDALRANIQNEDDARAAAAYLSSDNFIEQTRQAYMDAGLNEKDASDVAARMRDYLTASLTGDTNTMESIEDEVAKKIAGQKKLEWDRNELMETIASTSLLTGVTGLPGTITSAAKGAALRDELGSEGVSALAKTAIDFEDEDISRKAKTMYSVTESGKDLTSTQVYDLQVAALRQEEKDIKRQAASDRMASEAIRDNNLVSPYQIDGRGRVVRGEVTEKTYREETAKAKTAIEGVIKDTKDSLTTKEIDTGSRAIAAFKTGTFNINDANALNYSNRTVRTAFEEATGVDLGQYVVKYKDGEVNIPATNAATKDALFAMAADNLVASAEAETVNWMDNTKGEVVTQVTARMGASGTEALQAALDDVDERDRSTYIMTANAADMLYQTARNMGTQWEDVASQVTKMFPGIDDSKLKVMYEAGLADREMAADKARNRAVAMGESINKTGEQETSTGNVFIDTKVPPKGTVIRTFTEIANNLGADIHLTDEILNVDGTAIDGANGSYDPKTNTFYLNVSTGVEKNLGYIFMHEVTHYLKKYSPEEYLALENLVREKWYGYDPDQMADAIARKIEAYRIATDGKQTLTEEEALEEIIADSAHEFLNDRDFANKVAEEDPSLAKAVLNSIRNALRMLRRIFASGTIDDETHMDSLFSQLDIMTEAEDLWLKAYTAAVKRNADQAIDDLQDQIYEDSRYSVAEEKWERGEKLTKAKFNSFYSAHKLNFGRASAENMAEVIDKIKNDGFVSSTSIANVVPASINDFIDPKHPNLTQARYGAREGDTVMLVPNNYVDLKNDIIKSGFKPRDYEIVTVERDFQPYYELYSKAYDNSNAENATARFSITDSEGGYIGRSMSNRAARAYEQGEMPYSKWTKSDIIDAVADVNDSLDLSKLTLSELRENFLKYASWHHTGAFYQNTSFYAVDESKIESMTQEDVDQIVQNRTRNAKTAEQREAERRNTELVASTKDVLSKINLIYAAGDTGLKTVSGVVSRWTKGTLNLDDAYDKAIEAIKEKDRSKVDQWRKLPEDNARHKDVALYDNDIEAYAQKMYGSEAKANTKEYKAIKNYLSNETEVRFSVSDTDSDGSTRYSVTTEKEDFIKGANLSKELRDWAKEIGLDKLSKQPIKGPVIVSVRDLRTAWYEKNGRSDEAQVINTALDKIGDSLTKLVGEYQYIDLGDALNAAVTYRTDAEGHPTSVILSCQVKNAEYEVNFDFTTICAKRLAMQKILERFIKTEGERQGTTLYDELKLDEEGLYKLRLILETAGFEVSCRGCFVEQNRYSQQNQARTIANDWNAALDEWAKDNGTEITENFGLTALDIDNLDYEEIEAGFERYHELMKGKKTDVATKNRMLIEASPFFRKRMNASDYASMAGQRALMAIGESKKGGTNLYGLLKRGQSDSKQSVPFTAYNGEISLLPDNMKGKSLYDYLISIGGARAQSASDFQIEFVYDYMQMVADLSARGLPMHMYTKVIELAELFGMTGIKINLSAMCDVAEDLGGEYAGLKLVDGKYEYNISDQSIDYEKAVELQKRDGYSKNIGIIMVTLSSQHMLKSLDDPDVRYIIGYHSSAMPVVVANMSNMGGATDYTKINKTNKLNEKGQALFDAAMDEAKGNTELEKYKDALRIFDEKIQEETAKKKKKPRRGNEYGAYMSAYGNNTADFNTYDSLLETKDARKTADKYLEHCMKNDLIPIYFPFAFHENYYKCEVYDFNMYDNNTGEYAPMESVQNIYPGLNMAAGETDTTAFTERVSQMMDAQNRVNQALDSQYDAVFDEAKNTLRYSITGDSYMDIDASGIDHSELTHRADAIKTDAQIRDDAYMDAVNSGNMEEAQRLVDEAAHAAGMRVAHRYHGTMNANFTVFDKAYAKVGGNSGAGFYFSTEEDDSLNHYQDVDGADNYFKWHELAEAIWDTGELPDGTDIGDQIDSYEEAVQYAKDYLNKSPGTFDVYLNYKNPYIRDWANSTNIYDMLLDGFDESVIDRDDYEDDWEYDDAVWEARSEYISEAIYGAIYDAYRDMEDNYEILEMPTIDEVSRRIGEYAFDGSLTWKEIEDAVISAGDVVVTNPNWTDSGFAAPEFTRAIIENLGFDAIEDKEVSKKFGQLSREMMTDTEHIIVFKPEQIKLSDPVTYAEDGSVIPLSERFDPSNDDIRYSLPTQDSDGNILTDGQMEYFKNSQARDEQGRLVPVYHTTNHGGFTIFDPSYSDDKRSLFFASNFDVSQTYGRHANRPIEFLTDEEQMLADEFPFIAGNELTGKANRQAGYYSCYLNLENPLIVDAQNQNWNNIPYGEYSEDAVLAIKNLTVQDMGDGIYVNIWGDRKVDGEWQEFRESDTIEFEYLTVDGEYEIPERAWDEVYDFLVKQGLSSDYAYEHSDAFFDFNGLDTFDKDGRKVESDVRRYRTRELAALAATKGCDGVIIRNCYDIGAASHLKGEGLSDIYIAFSSNQVKDTRNENPTENPDIRYSFTPEEDVMDWLASQYDIDDVPLEDEQAEEGRVRMAKSKQEFISTTKTKWNERWLTEGKVLDKSANKHIKNVVMGVMANSSGDWKYKQQLVDKTYIAAKSAYWLMKDGKISEAGDVIYKAAVAIVQNADYLEDTQYTLYQDLRDYLRNTKISLGEEYWSDTDYAALRRRNLGRMKIVKGETNLYKVLDDLYHENSNGDIEGIAPEWFSPEAFEKNGYKMDSVPDILLQMESVLDTIQPYRVAYSSEQAEELVDQVASDLFDIVYEGKEFKSIADTFKERYDAKTKALKERHAEALRKVRERRDELLAEEKDRTARQKERAEKWKQRTAEEKEKRRKDKDIRKKAKHFGRIEDNIDWLTTRLLNETKDKNIPEGFRRTLAHMLMQFDMQTERSKKLEEKYGPAKKTLEIRKMKSRLEQIAKEDDSGEFRYDGYLFYLMDALAEKVDGKVIDSLDTEDLIVIDTMLKSIRHNFANYQKVRLQEKQVEIAALGDKTIEVMRKRIEKYGKRKVHTGGTVARGIDAVDTLLNEGEETPVYFFGRLDPNNEGIGAMWQELERGEDKHIRNMDFIRKRFQAICGDYFNKKKPGSELEKWRDASMAKTFNLKNGSITLNPAQIMSLYCLSKRDQALGHILGNGIVASPINTNQKLRQQIKGNEEQVNSVVLSYDEVKNIVSTLTPEQIKMAEELQSLMNNEMAAWGNETSLEMHGIKLFRENNYFPIKASNEVLNKSADSFDVQEKIKNFGFTKPLTKGANNAIVIDDIFSVTADHCNKMSLYNAFAIPISDFMRVYNYKQKNEDSADVSVQQMIGEAFTRKANSYIMKFIGDINGNTKTRSDAVNDLLNKTLANYKKAAIGANVRVALQQITSIFRAWMVINPKYFKALPSVRPSEMREMFEHCPKALWKSWGHYDVDMGRDIEDIMMNNDWSRFDMITMGAYGWLDNIAWTTIWQAVKAEVKAKNPNLEVGSDAYWEACNTRAKEVFDKTQVVDSIFNRSDVMRSKSTLTKMTTSFMAEPTLTYNVMRNALVEAHDAWVDGDKGKAIAIFNKMALVLGVNAAAVSAAAAIWDAVRGKGADDDDKDWGELWLMNFLENLRDNANMFKNIYFVKDVWDMFESAVTGSYYSQNNLTLEAFETIADGIKQMKKKIEKGSDKSWYDISMNLLGGIGYATGYPVKTIMRDIKAVCEKLNIDVLAADGTTEDKGGIDLDFDFSLPGITDGSGVDNFLNKLGINLTEEEKETRAINKKTEEISDKYSELSGEDKDKKVWSSVTTYAKEQNGDKGFADMVAEADYSTISKYRQMYLAAGGNAEYFDERVFDMSKKAMKKTIIYDATDEQMDQQERIKDYLLNHGMTESELSEIVYKSDVAKDMKIAFRLNNKDLMLESLRPLALAGISYDDLCRLWENRNRMQISSYKGRYKDKLKSTGKYIWPTQGVITSHYGRRSSPTAGASSYHEAIDIGASQGTPVVASDGGVIVEAGPHGGYGNSIGIRHDDGTVTYYNHLYSWNVKEGDVVAQGQQIAQVGSTGISTGPHLDFRIYKNGKYVDPESLLKS